MCAAICVENCRLLCIWSNRTSHMNYNTEKLLWKFNNNLMAKEVSNNNFGGFFIWKIFRKKAKCLFFVLWWLLMFHIFSRYKYTSTIINCYFSLANFPFDFRKKNLKNSIKNKKAIFYYAMENLERHKNYS